MDVQIAALCDFAADYGSKLCLMGTFDTIMAAQFPSIHPSCSIALRMVFRDTDAGRHVFKVTLIDEDGKSLLPKIEPAIDVRLPDNVFFITQNLIFNLQGMKFEKAGQYSIDIAMDGKMIARIPMQVIPMKQKPSP